MSESLGARLRKHRQDRKVPLRTIAEQTKIKLSMLEGLEKDDISQWPAGIFRRAYVRSYANAVGLDAETTIREFLETYPEASEPVEEALEHSAPPPTRFRSLIGSALGRLRRNEGPVAAPAVPPVPAPIQKREAAAASPRSASPVAPPHVERPVSVATAGREEAKAPDWLAAARICTELGRVQRLNDLKPLLRDAAGVLGAVGLIVWVWDPGTEQLRPGISHGYPAKLMARMPRVARDADNLTAAAFRSSETLAMEGEGSAAGALAVPLLAPSECVGVLAIELPRGSEQSAPVRAVATFFAAMLAQLFAGEAVSAAASPSAPSLAPASAYPADRMLPATSR